MCLKQKQRRQHYREMPNLLAICSVKIVVIVTVVLEELVMVVVMRSGCGDIGILPRRPNLAPSTRYLGLYHVEMFVLR